MVEGVMRPPVLTNTRCESCAGAAPLPKAAMQTSREGFADRRRKSCFTVGEGSRHVNRWESGLLRLLVRWPAAVCPIRLTLPFTVATRSPPARSGPLASAGGQQDEHGGESRRATLERSSLRTVMGLRWRTVADRERRCKRLSGLA